VNAVYPLLVTNFTFDFTFGHASVCHKFWLSHPDHTGNVFHHLLLTVIANDLPSYRLQTIPRGINQRSVAGANSDFLINVTTRSKSSTGWPG
jgi:hypothetical protein